MTRSEIGLSSPLRRLPAHQHNPGMCGSLVSPVDQCQSLLLVRPMKIYLPASCGHCAYPICTTTVANDVSVFTLDRHTLHREIWAVDRRASFFCRHGQGP